MKIIINYIKCQKLTALLLTVFIIIPYIAVCNYFPTIPYMNYFFLVILFLLKIMVFEETKIRKKIKPRVQAELTKELARNPSSDEIFKRTVFHLKSRDFSLLATGVGVLITSIYFGQF